MDQIPPPSYEHIINNNDFAFAYFSQKIEELQKQVINLEKEIYDLKSQKIAKNCDFHKRISLLEEINNWSHVNVLNQSEGPSREERAKIYSELIDDLHADTVDKLLDYLKSGIKVHDIKYMHHHEYPHSFYTETETTILEAFDARIKQLTGEYHLTNGKFHPVNCSRCQGILTCWYLDKWYEFVGIKCRLVRELLIKMSALK